ncbi:uncharacterized protein L969DRAFT_93167 [Mixia osmundae IAM 14324]|uniref:GRIP domain-containing protein n=1 Tax=Mixia osmundae (strain CBS 9802 / IAM 14324 / JCM 22182 / KY 12970) TaxID=764103 RepID=G7E5W5_MIXOS|nr:uncharacterized protein L969DRAFT_93167 [Mixia osmundae IAM 14324]KEI40623.1 hypothetical protein L969DRAFT_93167 [Mixia osmundae IAM 14324]GAA98225.1 hypothetical protein E5Q_04908 [Mixia osmundae IAM 14324]
MWSLKNLGDKVSSTLQELESSLQQQALAAQQQRQAQSTASPGSERASADKPASPSVTPHKQPTAKPVQATASPTSRAPSLNSSSARLASRLQTSLSSKAALPGSTASPTTSSLLASGSSTPDVKTTEKSAPVAHDETKLDLPAVDEQLASAKEAITDEAKATIDTSSASAVDGKTVSAEGGIVPVDDAVTLQSEPTIPADSALIAPEPVSAPLASDVPSESTEVVADVVSQPGVDKPGKPAPSVRAVSEETAPLATVEDPKAIIPANISTENTAAVASADLASAEATPLAAETETPNGKPVKTSPEINPAEPETVETVITETKENDIQARTSMEPEPVEEPAVPSQPVPNGNVSLEDGQPTADTTALLSRSETSTSPARIPSRVMESLPPVPTDGAVPSIDSTVHATIDQAANDPSNEEQSKPADRLADVMLAYKRLQKEKIAADRVLQQHTPLTSISDPDAMSGHLQNLILRADMSFGELKRVTAQLDQVKGRMEEMSSTHRMERQSQSAQIDQLKQQLEQKDASITALTEAQTKQDRVAKEGEGSKAEISKLQKSLEESQKTAKEEEEKRTKAMNLLKQIRQKMLKAEKDKTDVEKERDEVKGQVRISQANLVNEKIKMEQEVLALRAQSEQQVSRLRASFEREHQSVKQQLEREAAAQRGQAELDITTLKMAHTKELATKTARIQQLESLLAEATTAKDAIFDELQLRQAETESSGERRDALESRTKEMEYELESARERMESLQSQVDEARQAQNTRSSDGAQHLRKAADIEARHLIKVAALETQITRLERDRADAEEEMAGRLQERLRETDRLRQEIARRDAYSVESEQTRRERQTAHEETEEKLRQAIARSQSFEQHTVKLRQDAQTAIEKEGRLRQDMRHLDERISDLDVRLEDAQQRECTLKQQNKSLRDELRKVQSGIMLAEKQRNPGVGYFTTFSQSQSARDPADSVSGSQASVAGSPGPRSPNKAEEALNFEYVRNVILQFLEHKEMRPHLLSVLGTILHFTPQEARRLAAKASA